MEGSSSRGIVGRIWERVVQLLSNSDDVKAKTDQFEFVDGKLRTTGEDGSGGGGGLDQDILDELIELNSKVALDDTLDLVATEATQELIRLLLVALNGKDYATETTLEAARVLLNSLNGKDYATEATLNALKTVVDAIKLDTAKLDVNLSTRASEATLEAIRLLNVALNAKDFATEATQAGIKAKTDQLTFVGDELKVTSSTVPVVAPPIWGARVQITVDDTGLSEIPVNLTRKALRMSNENGEDAWFTFGDFLPVEKEDIKFGKEVSFIFELSEVGTGKIRIVAKGGKTTVVTYQEAN